MLIEPRSGPERAPHCPDCGYNLYRLEERRCPECGRVFATDEEWDEARLNAPVNAPDRRAMLREKNYTVAGFILIAAGLAMMIVHNELHPSPPFWYTSSRHYQIRIVSWIVLIAVLSIYPVKRRIDREPIGKTLLIIGAILGLLGGLALFGY